MAGTGHLLVSVRVSGVAAVVVCAAAAGLWQPALAVMPSAAAAVQAAPGGQLASSVAARRASGYAVACRDVYLLGARGSGEPVTPEFHGLGPEVSKMATVIGEDLQAAHRGSFATLNVGYAADSVDDLKPTSYELGLFATSPAAAAVYYYDHNVKKYLSSIDDGITSTVDEAVYLHSHCPRAVLVLAGYSQGAMVMHQAELKLAADGDAGVLSHIAGTLLLADGDRVSHTAAREFGTSSGRSEGVRPWLHASSRKDVFYPAATANICDAGDIVCDFGINTVIAWKKGIQVHTSYAVRQPDGSYTYDPALAKAANWIANLVSERLTTIYVVDYESATAAGAVTPITVASWKPGPAIAVPNTSPAWMAITPNGKTGYVFDDATFGRITPINIALNTAGPEIDMDKNSFAITPDSKTLLVTNAINGPPYTVTPIQTATNTVGARIGVGSCDPNRIGITPDSKTAYVLCDPGGAVPIRLATRAVGAEIPIGHEPAQVAITPDGAHAYVTTFYSNTVTPIRTSSNTASPAIAITGHPSQIAITPDSATAYVLSGTGTASYLTPINTATGTAGKPLKLPAPAGRMLMAPDGTTIYLLAPGKMMIVRTSTNTVAKTVTTSAGSGNDYVADMQMSRDGETIYILDIPATGLVGYVTPFYAATETPGTRVSAGEDPQSLAIAP